MMALETRPLVLTACLDQQAHACFDGLRKTHFPLQRNVIGAHLTLFHHLPGERRQDIIESIRDLCAVAPPLVLEFAGIMKLGRGVAFRFRSPTLEAMRTKLAEMWAADLTPQDRAPFRPHVTIQNKVEPRTADELADNLRSNLPKAVRIEGFTVWRYLGGPWAHQATLPFLS